MTTFLLLLLVPVVFSASAPCPRYPTGSLLVPPADLFSNFGVLNVTFTYQTRTDEFGNVLYCYTTPDGLQSPTLHLKQGDQLSITLINQIPVDSSGSFPLNTTYVECGSAYTVDPTSTNIHFHGLSISPMCHVDNILTIVVNSGQQYTYSFTIPSAQPPGLYAYHYHIHGQIDAALLGGASGAIVIEGIEDLQSRVQGLPEQILIIRDNAVPGNSSTPPAPAWDISINYIPIPYPDYPPAVVMMKPNERQFWRLLNAASDTILQIQLLYDDVPQILEIVALDGTALSSQEGLVAGSYLGLTQIVLGQFSRAEFIVNGPSANVTNATLCTLLVDTGPDGDFDPIRPILVIETNTTADEPVLRMPYFTIGLNANRVNSQDLEVVKNRTIYFSEVVTDPSNPLSPTNFYITVDGQTPTLFSLQNPPAIVALQNTVEEWVIENRASENHIFHIHQLHFLLLEIDGVPVSIEQQQYLDVIQIPYWSGTGAYPSVKVRMDFQTVDIGYFVYHCHISQHEDGGMMAIIEVAVNPNNNGTSFEDDDFFSASDRLRPVISFVLLFFVLFLQ